MEVNSMDLNVLKKKISTYKTEGGYLKTVSDDLLMEILTAWENWTGPSSSFYSAIDVDYRKMASIIGRAKKLKRDGHFPDSDFKEVLVETPPTNTVSMDHGIELLWDNGRIIRFRNSNLLLDFLKKIDKEKKAA